MDPCHHCDREPCECQKPEPMRVWLVTEAGRVRGAHRTKVGAEAHAGAIRDEGDWVLPSVFSFEVKE
jgi:hypothetical protein